MSEADRDGAVGMAEEERGEASPWRRAAHSARPLKTGPRRSRLRTRESHAMVDMR